tara:strand:+ start:1180 stop:1590 length:411 start_codon:yes stop_codon:yes gene_type:complete
MNSIAVKNSLIGVMLPQEIKEYIWSFNYDWASNIIQKSSQRFIRNKVNNIEKIIINEYKKGNYVLHTNNPLCYKDFVLTKKQVFDTMVSCKCCPRHQVNKPTHFNKYVETEFHGTQKTNCFCSCRHNARMICRYIN